MAGKSGASKQPDRSRIWPRGSSKERLQGLLATREADELDRMMSARARTASGALLPPKPGPPKSGPFRSRRGPEKLKIPKKKAAKKKAAKKK